MHQHRSNALRVTSPSIFRLRVLGPVTVRHDADTAASTRITQPRQIALLCYLTLARPRGLHSRDALIALLWPDYDAERGRRALRNALHGLRQRLGPHVLLTAGDGLVGIDPAHLTCDALDLERGALPRPEQLPYGVAQPFAALHVNSAAAFDRWMSRERQRLEKLQGTYRGSGEWPSVAPAAEGEARRVRPHRPDAYAMYLRGHFLFLRAAHGGPVEELLDSRRCFERALALDPTSGLVLAGLANFFAVAARRGVITPFAETFARTIEYSHQALALDPTLAIPHVHFGVQALYLDDDWERAGREFAAAVRKEPEYVEARRFYGVWLGMVHRYGDALSEMEAAEALEPDMPQILSSLGSARLAAGAVVGAEQAFARTLAIDPRHGPARERLLRIFEDAGRFEDAVAERERAPALLGARNFRERWNTSGAAGYRDARSEELKLEIAAIESRLIERAELTVNDRFTPPVVRLVSLCLQLGDTKRARAWQMQATAGRPVLARWFASLPELRARR